MKYKQILLVTVAILLGHQISAQHVFQDEIDAFKKADAEKMPPAKAILFTGSSSFRLWTDVSDYFPGYTIINRGIGGSTLADLIYFYKDAILPYHPRQIVMYCGENDFAASDTVTVETVVTRFKQLYYLIRADYRKTPLAYVAMKPSPSRKHLMPKYESANKAIAAFLKKQKNTAFIDVYKNMLAPDGNPMNDIFKNDNLHMNAKGYTIWQRIIQPYLLKD